jgi:hypothetical protein
MRPTFVVSFPFLLGSQTRWIEPVEPPSLPASPPADRTIDGVFTAPESGDYVLRVTTHGTGPKTGHYAVLSWRGNVPNAH